MAVCEEHVWRTDYIEYGEMLDNGAQEMTHGQRCTKCDVTQQVDDQYWANDRPPGRVYLDQYGRPLF